MASLKLKKISWQRRRFIPSKALLDIHNWMDEREHLKESILNDSTFQVLGQKSVIEVNSVDFSARVLIEVVGIPKTELKSFDLEACDVLVFAVDSEALDLSFLELNSKAREILNGIAQPLSKTYHIVVEGAKLELHFFMQKDYIQSTH